jgi:hypothetical protein
METKKRVLRLEDIDKIKTLLEEIWALGDKDEMSIKHIGHSLASLVATGDVLHAIDYNRPDMDMTDNQLDQLDEKWDEVSGWLHGVSREECISVFEYLPIAQYGAIFLEWKEYAQTYDRQASPAKMERILSNAEDGW